jgi:hypothetical protein
MGGIYSLLLPTIFMQASCAQKSRDLMSQTLEKYQLVFRFFREPKEVHAESLA